MYSTSDMTTMEMLEELSLCLMNAIKKFFLDGEGAQVMILYQNENLTPRLK